NSLGFFVLWMRFARKHKLDRTLSVIDERRETIRIAQQQIPSFVSSHASRKANRQNFRIEHRARRLDVLFAFTTGQARIERMIANERHQALLQKQVPFPKLLVGKFVDSVGPNILSAGSIN